MIYITNATTISTQCLELEQNWSDFEIWWPKKNKWLLKSNHALVREEVQADAQLMFTKKNKVTITGYMSKVKYRL